MVELFAFPALAVAAAAVDPSDASSASTGVAIGAKDFPSFGSSAAACWDSFDSLAAAVAFRFAAAVVVDVVAAAAAGEDNFDLKRKIIVNFSFVNSKNYSHLEPEFAAAAVDFAPASSDPVAFAFAACFQDSAVEVHSSSADAGDSCPASFAVVASENFPVPRAVAAFGN